MVPLATVDTRITRVSMDDDTFPAGAGQLALHYRVRTLAKPFPKQVSLYPRIEKNSCTNATIVTKNSHKQILG